MTQMLMRLFERDRRRRAAADIQRVCWYGPAGRRRYARCKERARHERREELLKDRDYVMRTGFRQTGAVHVPTQHPRHT